jgi:hypothetical protein
LDETSLLVRNYYRPAVVWKTGTCVPAWSPSDSIFSCTAVFIVAADGSSCDSTLLLNSKAEMGALSTFGRSGIQIKYYIFFIKV